MKIHSKYLQIRENTWKLWQKWYSIKEYKKEVSALLHRAPLPMEVLLCTIHSHSFQTPGFWFGWCMCMCFKYISMILKYWDWQHACIKAPKTHCCPLFFMHIIINHYKKKRDRTPMGIKNDIWEQSVICHYSFWHANINTS